MIADIDKARLEVLMVTEFANETLQEDNSYNFYTELDGQEYLVIAEADDNLELTDFRFVGV